MLLLLLLLLLLQLLLQLQLMLLPLLLPLPLPPMTPLSLLLFFKKENKTAKCQMHTPVTANFLTLPIILVPGFSCRAQMEAFARLMCSA